MAVSKTVRTKRDGVITYSDSGAANSLIVQYEPGDVSYTAAGYGIEYYLDRTEHMCPRLGDAQTTTFSHSVHVTTFSSTTEATLPDIAEYYARTSAWVYLNWTTTLAASDAFSVDMDYVIDGTFVGEADVSLHFDDAQLNGSFTEGAPDSYSVNGTSATLGPVVT